MRLLPIFLVLLLLTDCAVPGFARTRHTAAEGQAARIRAQHLIRLAAKEKKAWRQHLAKLHSLPRTARRTEKRHEKLWQSKHDVKVAALHQAHVAKVLQAEQEARVARRTQSRLARLHHAQAVVAATAPRRHQRQAVAVAAASRRNAGQARWAAHARNLAAQAARRQTVAARRQNTLRARLAQEQRFSRAKIARAQAVRALHQAHIVALYRAHLGNLRATHNARASAQRAHQIALRGDGSGGRNIRFWQTAAANVPVKVISVDLNDPDVKVSAVMARRGNGTSEPFRQMIGRANPNVAVTGTFFSLGDLQPVGDIVIDGSLVHFGGMGTALCITPRNHAEMVTVTWGRHHDWSPYDFVVACGPRLLRRGRVVLDPRAERFRDKHMLAPNSRIAVGITRGNTLFFAMTHQPISLGRLARAMKALGATEAMNLDAGTSTGFYYNGATLARPGRQLTNMIVVYGHRDRYERALNQLVPDAYRRSARRYHQLSSNTPSNTPTGAGRL